jgi:hypothetical protein
MTTKLAGCAMALALVAGCGGVYEQAPATGSQSDALEARTADAEQDDDGGPPRLGLHYARGQVRTSSSPNMTNHGGLIMPDAAVTSIFWGTGWASSSFVGDKETGIDAFYAGLGGSSYSATVDEYSGTNGQVTSATTYAGHLVDTSAGPTRAPSTTTILNEVCKMISSPVADGYYPVYTDLARGSAGYCAWHSNGTCNGVNVRFAFFFKLDGDAGCDPQDTSGLHSQGLAALANVSGHELSEARSDPDGATWYDSRGSENADKCAWTFGTPLLTFANGTQWKVQGNWSNAAYTAHTGYPNSSGQKGCRDGGNY